MFTISLLTSTPSAAVTPNLIAICITGLISGISRNTDFPSADTVTLFTARINWTEWGQENIGSIISRRVPCAGCGIGLDGEDCGKDFACLRQIRPEEVFEAVRDVLREAELTSLLRSSTSGR